MISITTGEFRNIHLLTITPDVTVSQHYDRLSEALDTAGFRPAVGGGWEFGTLPKTHLCGHEVGRMSQKGLKCNSCRIKDLEEKVRKLESIIELADVLEEVGFDGGL